MKYAAETCFNLLQNTNWTHRLNDDGNALNFYNKRGELIYSFKMECTIHKVDHHYSSIDPTVAWWVISDEN